MKIAFLCGSLEPGKDGVGDYCRKLAKELQALGHSLLLIALKDPHVSEMTKKEEGYASLVRIPAHANLYRKTKQIRNRLESFQPDLVSIQMVAYSFHPKGILFSYPSFFEHLTQGFSTHLMFHELWLGAHIGASWKQRLNGIIQKYYILKLVRKVNPIRIHTTCGAFQFLLSHNNIQSKILPVFSNIESKENPDQEWIYKRLEYITGFSAETRQRFLLFLFFGNIHPSWDFQSTMEILKDAGKKYSKEILICHAGKPGVEENIWAKMMARYNELHFYRFGELKERNISDLLSFADFGLTSYPSILTGKSGSIAAMKEHNLPVIISNFDLKIKGYREDINEPLLIPIGKLHEKLPLLQKQKPPSPLLKEMADRLLKEINL